MFTHYEALHPLSDKDNLSQVKGEVQNESNKGFIFKSNDDYIPISILVNLDLWTYVTLQHVVKLSWIPCGAIFNSWPHANVRLDY